MTFKKQLYSPTSFFSPDPYASTPLTSVTSSPHGTHESPVSGISSRDNTKLALTGNFLCALNVSDKEKVMDDQKTAKKITKDKALANLLYSRNVRSWKSRKHQFFGHST